VKILVTGCAGFIGSTTVELLSDNGHTLFGIDDHSNSCVDFIDLPLRLGVSRDVADGLHLLEDDAIDLVVHTAGPVGAVGILSKSGKIASEILRTTRAVLDYCEFFGSRLIYVSSSEVYGRSGSYSEADDLIVPCRGAARFEYAAGKIAAEQAVLGSPVDSLIIRPFNVVGSRQRRDGGFVLPTFAEQAMSGEALTVFDGGRQRRAFTAVEDVARFIHHVSDLDVFDGRVVNVGNPHNEVTIMGLAEMMLRIAGRSIDISYTSGKAVHGEAYEEAVGHSKLPIITRAEDLGWTPHVGIEKIAMQVLSMVGV
jgi:nucleoside-diphosphate-sugar epimerase